MKINFPFECPHCEKSQTITLPAPEPIYADRNSESQNCLEDEDFHCQECGSHYTADIWNSMGGPWYHVYDENGDQIICDEFDCDVYYDEEDQDYDDEVEWWISSDASEFCKQLQKHLFKAQQLINTLLENNNTDNETKNMLSIMLYGHVVAAFEGYLEMSFVNNVFTRDGALKRYVTSNPEMKNAKFSLSEIFDKYDEIKTTAKNYLKKIIFHDLGKAKQMYQCAFNFDFGDIKYFCQAVHKRHDCVHRAGRTKDGQEIIITIDELKELIEKIDEFSRKLELHWKSNQPLTK